MEAHVREIFGQRSKACACCDTWISYFFPRWGRRGKLRTRAFSPEKTFIHKGEVWGNSVKGTRKQTYLRGGEEGIKPLLLPPQLFPNYFIGVWLQETEGRCEKERKGTKGNFPVWLKQKRLKFLFLSWKYAAKNASNISLLCLPVPWGGQNYPCSSYISSIYPSFLLPPFPKLASQVRK